MAESHVFFLPLFRCQYPNLYSSANLSDSRAFNRRLDLSHVEPLMLSLLVRLRASLFLFVDEMGFAEIVGSGNVSSV